MKIIKKILATVAALMLCVTMAMPAFAADTMTDTNETAAESDSWDANGAVVSTEDGTNIKVDAATKDGTTDDFTSDSAALDTQVDIRIAETKIRVAVPLKLALVTDTAGGDIYAPDNYHIENLSKGSVWVTGVRFSSPASPYSLVSEESALSDYDTLYIPFNVEDASLHTHCGNSGLVDLNKNWSISGLGASYQGTEVFGGGVKSEIDLTGGSSSALSSANDVSDIFKITYIISAKEPTNPPI